LLSKIRHRHTDDEEKVSDVGQAADKELDKELDGPVSPKGVESSGAGSPRRIEEMDAEEVHQRFLLLHENAMIQQTAISRIIFILFLSFPNLTNKVFSFFMW
jgi:hypothetical protein